MNRTLSSSTGTTATGTTATMPPPPPQDLKLAIEAFLGVSVQDEDFGIPLRVVGLFELLLLRLRDVRPETLVSLSADATNDDNATTLSSSIYLKSHAIVSFERTCRTVLNELNITDFSIYDFIFPEPHRIRSILGAAMAFVRRNHFVCPLIEELELDSNERTMGILRYEEGIDENEQAIARRRAEDARQLSDATAQESENEKLGSRLPGLDRVRQATAEAAEHARRLNAELLEAVKIRQADKLRISEELAGLRKLIVNDPSVLIDEIDRGRRQLEHERAEESELQAKIGANCAQLREDEAATKILSENIATAQELRQLRETNLREEEELQETKRRFSELQSAFKATENYVNDQSTQLREIKAKISDLRARKAQIKQDTERTLAEDRAEREIVNRESKDTQARCEELNALIQQSNYETKELRRVSMDRIGEKVREMDKCYRVAKMTFESELQSFQKNY